MKSLCTPLDLSNLTCIFNLPDAKGTFLSQPIYCFSWDLQSCHVYIINMPINQVFVTYLVNDAGDFFFKDTDLKVLCI